MPRRPESGNHLSRLCSRTFSSMTKLTSSSGPEYVIRNRPGKINHWYRHPYEKCLNSTYGYRHLNSTTSFLSRTLGSRAAPMIASRNSKTTVADCRWPLPSSIAASSLSVAMRSRSDTSHQACHAILGHTINLGGRRGAHWRWPKIGGRSSSQLLRLLEALLRFLAFVLFPFGFTVFLRRSV
jgi:hypothetical protein